MYLNRSRLRKQGLGSSTTSTSSTSSTSSLSSSSLSYSQIHMGTPKQESGIGRTRNSPPEMLYSSQGSPWKVKESGSGTGNDGGEGSGIVEYNRTKMLKRLPETTTQFDRKQDEFRMSELDNQDTNGNGKMDEEVKSQSHIPYSMSEAKLMEFQPSVQSLIVSMNATHEREMKELQGNLKRAQSAYKENSDRLLDSYGTIKKLRTENESQKSELEHSRRRIQLLKEGLSDSERNADDVRQQLRASNRKLERELGSQTNVVLLEKYKKAKDEISRLNKLVKQGGGRTRELSLLDFAEEEERMDRGSRYSYGSRTMAGERDMGQIEKYREKIDSLERYVEELERIRGECNQEMLSMEKQIAKLQGEKREQDQVIGRHKQKLLEIEAKTTSLHRKMQSRMQSQQDEKSDVEVLYQQECEKNQVLRHNLSKLKGTENDLRNQVANLHDTLNLLTSENQQALELLKGNKETQKAAKLLQEELTPLRIHLQTAQGEVTKQTETINNLRQEVASAKTELHDQQVQAGRHLTLMTSERDELREQVVGLKQSVNRLETELSESKSRYTDHLNTMQQSLDEMDDSRNGYKQSSDSQKETNEILQKQVAELKERNKKQKEDLKNGELYANDLLDQLNEMKERHGKLQGQAEELERGLKSERVQAQALEHRLHMVEQLVEEKDVAQEQMKKHVEDAIVRSTEEVKELRQKAGVVDLLDRQLENKTKKQEELTTRLATAESELVHEREQRQQLENELQIAKNRWETETQRVESLQQLDTTMNRQLETLNESRERDRRVIEQLEQDLRVSKEEHESSRVEYEQRILRLETDLGDAHHSRAGPSAETDRKQRDQISELIRENQKLKAELENVNNSLALSDASLDLENSWMKDEIEQLRQSISKEKQEMGNEAPKPGNGNGNGGDNMALQGQIEDLKRGMDDKEHENRALHERVQELEKELMRERQQMGAELDDFMEASDQAREARETREIEIQRRIQGVMEHLLRVAKDQNRYRGLVTLSKRSRETLERLVQEYGEVLGAERASQEELIVEGRQLIQALERSLDDAMESTLHDSENVEQELEKCQLVIAELQLVNTSLELQAEKLRENLQDERSKSQIMAKASQLSDASMRSGPRMSSSMTTPRRGGNVSRNRLLGAGEDNDDDDWGGRYSGLSVPQSPGLLNLIEQRHHGTPRGVVQGLSVDDL